MAVRIGNAPCSWGVEFADDPRNPSWRQVLRECAGAGYRGIELGPVGFMPDDPAVLGEALREHDLELAGAVVFQPFHEPAAWAEVRDATARTCRALANHGARQLVLIDSISPRRVATLGRPGDAPQLDADDWRGYAGRLRDAARLAVEDHGLVASMHAHAGGFCEFEHELARLLDEVRDDLLRVCIDTAHALLAGMDPLALMRRYGDRVSHVHLKDLDADMKARTIAEGTDFYEACADGLFCALGEGEVDFGAVRACLDEIGFDGWCVVEQDCAADAGRSQEPAAAANRIHLERHGFG